MAVRAWPAGELRHTVIVEVPTGTVRKTDGTYTKPTASAALRWRVAIRQLRGQERFEAQQIQADATHEVKGRYYPGLTTKHTLQFGARTFNIVSVNNVEEANINHVLQCRELI